MRPLGRPFLFQGDDDGVVVGEGGLDAAVAEGGELLGAEHHVDAEAGETAVIGGAEPQSLVAVGIIQILGNLTIEVRRGDIVHVAGQD